MTRIVRSVLIVAALVVVLRSTPAAAQPPAAATGLTTTTARSVILAWNHVAGATWYYVWVNGQQGVTYRQWYQLSDLDCSDGMPVFCQVGVPLWLATNGNAIWWVQSWGNGGYGPWSAPNSFGPPGPYYAVINKDGSTARGNNVSSQRLSTGFYEVIFGRNIAACAFTAQLGGVDSEYGLSGTTAVARRSGNTGGVLVVIADLSDSLLDESFHLTITCP